MEELIQAMSIPELEVFKTTYKDNESVCKVIDGYIEVKVATEVQAKAQEAFGKAIGKMVDKLPHPDNVHNVYLAWQEVEEEDTTQEADSIVVFNKDGTPLGCEVEALSDDQKKELDKGDLVLECRYPLVKLHKWIVTLNKGFVVNRSGSGNGGVTSSKRGITVSKRGEANPSQLELVGNFPNASKACEHLKLLLGGDSGTRVLQREGLFLEPYEGTEYTSD